MAINAYRGFRDARMTLTCERIRYTNKQISALCRISPAKLRSYEERGLLHPAAAGKLCVYGYEDRLRVEMLKNAERLGIRLKDLAVLMDDAILKPDVPTWDGMGNDVLGAQLEVLKAQRDEIDSYIREITGIIGP